MALNTAVAVIFVSISLAPSVVNASAAVNETAALTNPLRSDLIEPDRAKNCKQPAVDSRSWDKLIGALYGAQACRLHEVVSHVPRSRQDQRISPKARQGGLEPGPHFPSARFAHGPAGAHAPLFFWYRRTFASAIGQMLVNAGVAQRWCCGTVCAPHLILIASGSLGASCLWLFCHHLLYLEHDRVTARSAASQFFVSRPPPGAVLGDEPFHVVAPAPPARLTDDRQRRGAYVRQDQGAVSRHCPDDSASIRTPRSKRACPRALCQPLATWMITSPWLSPRPRAFPDHAARLPGRGPLC